MKKDNACTRLESRSPVGWRRLVDRYFDAQTTEAEERQLRLFLATEGAAGPEFDEIKAVMGFLVTGKALHQSAKKRSVPFHASRWVAAAIAFLVISTATWQVMDHRQNVCVAYIYGEKCTDAHQVMSQLRLSLSQLRHEEEDMTVESQLNDIFHTLGDEDVTTIVNDANQ